MAVGKDKHLTNSGKKEDKEVVDPFSKKDWYDMKAPAMFNIRNIGKTRGFKEPNHVRWSRGLCF